MPDGNDNMVERTEVSDGNFEEEEDEDVAENGVEEEEDEGFSDPEGFIDDMSDEELLPDILDQRPKETDSLENVVVVDGVPQVGAERLEKLQNVIRKIFIRFGRIVNEEYPELDGKTTGFIFLEYSSPSSALEAVKMGNGYKLDKQHTFTVNLFTDFDKYTNIPDEWEPPEPQPYKEHGNLHWWLLDEESYDQFSVIHEGGDKTSIYKNSLPERTLLEERNRWTETYVRWSHQGTYLCTFHARGIALWGGERFRQIMKFSHPNVQFIDFSPMETYLVTFSPLGDQKEVIIWDIRTGVKKRSFQFDHPPVWPIFKWSHDDKYFARLTTDTLSIYETPSFGLLDKKSLKLTGARDFTWSPADNIIGYWVGEAKDVPARMILVEIPSRNELRSKNLFNVADCKMHWQKTGDYLTVKVDRYAKVKKEKNELKYGGLYYNFEIFHMRERHIPADIVEIKEPIVAFAWEPFGEKFCIIHGEAPNVSVSFYGVKPGGSPALLKKFEKKACNHAFWSPNGQFIVLAGLRTMNGVFEFIDTANWTVLGEGEHFTATDVEWDPTGRYVVTAVSNWVAKNDNAYWLWNFQGKVLQRHSMDGFCQLLWRPRPQSLLTKEHVEDIKKNLKKYSIQFEAKDRMSLTKASKELVEKRKNLLKQFEDYRQSRLADYLESKPRRLELRYNIDTDELNSHVENMEEEVVEFFIKEDIVVLEE